MAVSRQVANNTLINLWKREFNFHGLGLFEGFGSRWVLFGCGVLACWHAPSFFFCSWFSWSPRRLSCVRLFFVPVSQSFGRMEGSVRHEGSALEGKLRMVEEEITTVEAEIAKVVSKLEPLEEKEENESLTEREEKRLDALRKEKEQLRKEKEQLRDEKNLLFRMTNTSGSGVEQLTDRMAVVSLHSAILDPPPTLQTPSSISLQLIASVTCSVLPCERRVFVDVCRVLNGGEAPVKRDGVAAEVWKVLNLASGFDTHEAPLTERIRFGKFQDSYAVPKNELFLTSILVCELQARMEMIGEWPARWEHQTLDRSGGKLDIMAYCVHNPSLWCPVLIVEADLQKKDKQAQTLGYAVNVASQLRPGEVMLAAEVYLKVFERRLRVHGVRVAPEKKLATALLFDGDLTEKSLGALLESVDMVARANANQPRVWVTLKNAALGDGRVWKSFDYRGRTVAPEQRRDMALSLTEIPGCKVEVQAADFAIISYPFIAGSHRPSCAGQFVALVEQLSSLHSRNLVHGDVRASNIVFGNGTAKLIDFDFAGSAEVKKYPEGFVTDAKSLGDGARHRSAQAGRGLKPEHDWFSLGTVMELVEPENREDIARWQEVVRKLQAVEVNVADVLEVLGAMDKTPLKLKNELPPATATGSPPRKDGKSTKSH